MAASVQKNTRRPSHREGDPAAGPSNHVGNHHVEWYYRRDDQPSEEVGREAFLASFSFFFSAAVFNGTFLVSFFCLDLSPMTASCSSSSVLIVVPTGKGR